MQFNTDKKICCVIPARNEEKVIAQVVESLNAYFSEIIVVDDGSSDNTSEYALKAQALVLRHLVNRGQGASLETGNEMARQLGADIVVHFDGDGQFDKNDIPKILQPILSGQADMVFGSRFLGVSSEIPAFKLKILFPIARLVNNLFFGIKLSDPQIGFRAFNKKALEQIKIELDDYAHCTEIMYKACQSELRLKEVPVKVYYNRFGMNFRGGVKIFKDLMIAKLLF